MSMTYADFQRLVSADPSSGGGSSVKMVNVATYGASGAATPAANTAAINQAVAAALASGNSALLFPDDHYRLAGPIRVGTDPNTDITGLRFYGQSRGGTILEQTTDNAAIWSLTARFMHTCLWEHFTFTYTNMQTGLTGANVFENLTTDGNMYMNSWKDIGGSNFYRFMQCPTALWWGNSYEDFWLGDFAGGVNNITGEAGEPNCRFSRMYITCQSAVETLFRHEAMAAEYHNIEVNSASKGIAMLYDGSSGTHVISHWALEGGYYADDQILFEVPNGILLADFIYTETLHVETGKQVVVYQCEGDRSFMDIRFHSIRGIDDANTGRIIAAQAAGPRKIRFREIIMPWDNPLVNLTDVAGTESANYVEVDSWNDASRLASRADAGVTLTCDDAFEQFFDVQLTAQRQAAMPPDDNMFTGRRFRINRANSNGTFPLVITDSGGTEITRIAGGTRGIVDVVWRRGKGWSVADARAY
jgi:hypothetical protein